MQKKLSTYYGTNRNFSGLSARSEPPERPEKLRLIMALFSGVNLSNHKSQLLGPFRQSSDISLVNGEAGEVSDITRKFFRLSEKSERLRL